MIKPMFPHPWHTPRRAVLSPEPQQVHDAARRRQIRLFVGGLVFGIGETVAYLLRDVPVTTLIVALLAAVVALVIVDPGDHLLATVAPLPDVHTPPIATATGLIRVVQVIAAPRPRPDRAAGAIDAIAQQAGVLRLGAHSMRAIAESNVPTTAIPVVSAAVQA